MSQLKGEGTMPTLHLMVGLPCSGKTTRSRQLAQEYHAVLFTPDVWHLQLFGQDLAHPDHGRNHDMVEKIMWDTAERILQLGVDVVLDFGLWGRDERADFRNRAKALGADCRFYYMDVPQEELLRRLEQRNQQASQDVFVIPKQEMLRYIALFQPPMEEEIAAFGCRG